ncbi:hypothetical protein EV702DRAFT_1070207 [Suillus placidus]|uniref:Uncharacterized protein n=1 Tax=Suillus placidus TaxID=48579 RepID=A0A9P7A4A2_9AGAM|nr:hypothetical protein EV702DRAFT_1070207 [Suillus placidus]
MQYSSWITIFLVAFGGLAPTLAAPLEDGHHSNSVLAHGLKAKHLAKRNDSDHSGCGGGTLANISAVIENLLNNVTINILSNDANKN